jgi:biopolymer transport protein ExbB
MLSDAFEILARGGPVMIPIICVSVAAWTIIFIRLFAIKRESLELGEFLWRLETRLLSGGRPSALALCWETRVPIAAMLAPLFARPAVSKNIRRRAVQQAVELERGRIGRQLPMLAVLAGAATLLGLLGTVAGMISSFGVVTVHGTGEPALLAVGISQALITTEAGLVVALPLLLAHTYLASRVENTAVEAHRKLLDISAGLGAGEVK